jgi:hypothetical protein
MPVAIGNIGSAVNPKASPTYPDLSPPLPNAGIMQIQIIACSGGGTNTFGKKIRSHTTGCGLICLNPGRNRKVLVCPEVPEIIVCYLHTIISPVKVQGGVELAGLPLAQASLVELELQVPEEALEPPVP